MCQEVFAGLKLPSFLKQSCKPLTGAEKALLFVCFWFTYAYFNSRHIKNPTSGYSMSAAPYATGLHQVLARPKGPKTPNNVQKSQMEAGQPRVPLHSFAVRV